MFPTLIQLGPVAIPSAGILFSLGFFFGSYLVWSKTKEEHFEEELVMDGMLLVIFVSLIFSRVSYVVFNWHRFGSFFAPFELIKRPGFSWPGALIAGIITLIFYCRRLKWDFYKISDLSIFGLLLGMIFAKVGLFLNNFIPGEFYQSSFLWEAVSLIILYRILIFLDKNYRTYEWYKNKRGEANPGFITLSFLMLSSLINLIISLVNRPFFQLTEPAFIFNLVVIMVSGGLFWFRSGRSLTNSWQWFKKKNRPLLKNNKAGFHFKTGMEAKQ